MRLMVVASEETLVILGEETRYRSTHKDVIKAIPILICCCSGELPLKNKMQWGRLGGPYDVLTLLKVGGGGGAGSPNFGSVD